MAGTICLHYPNNFHYDIKRTHTLDKVAGTQTSQDKEKARPISTLTIREADQHE